MKKITSKKFSKRLLQYGALTVAALGVSDATGQIIYVDVDPDATLDVGDAFSLDISGDSLENFNFSNPDGLAGGNAAIVLTSDGGAFVGFTAGAYQYPAVLADGDVIDDASGYTADGARGDLNYYGCAYSNSQWCDAIVDGFLGVRFVDLAGAGTTHYGWVRLDTDVGGSNLMVIKDYAYNSVANEGIMAGEGLLSVGDNQFENFSYFVNDRNSLVLKSAVALENVVIYNLLGQQVVSQKLSNTNETINLASYETGIYIAKVSIEGQSKSFKIIKN